MEKNGYFKNNPSPVNRFHDVIDGIGVVLAMSGVIVCFALLASYYP